MTRRRFRCFLASIVLLFLSFVTAAYADPGGGSRGAAAPAGTWTGFYVGALAGGGFVRDSMQFSGDPVLGQLLFIGFPNGFFDPPLASRLSVHTTRPIAGVKVGYRAHVGTRMIGVEADFTRLNLSRTASSQEVDLPSGPLTHVFTMQLNGTVDWLGTVRARVGLAPDRKVLPFATGGLSFGDTTNTLTYAHTAGALNADDTFGTASGVGMVCLTGGGPCLSGSTSQHWVGWSAGAGLEMTAGHRVTVDAEYLLVDARGQSIVARSTGQSHGPITTSPSVFIRSDITTAVHEARVALNVRF